MFLKPSIKAPYNGYLKIYAVRDRVRTGTLRKIYINLIPMRIKGKMTDENVD